MKQIITLCCSTLFALTCWAQAGTIKGHIHDRLEQEGFYGVNVTLIGQNKTVLTDFNGDFILEDIPAGSYDLQFSFLGFPDTTLKAIQVAPDTVIDLQIDYPPPCRYDSNGSTCPVCQKSDQVIPIVFGYPGKKLMKYANKGKVMLGGCMVSYCDPNWYCKRDQTRF
ncbi:MAG: carboxypeptidase-like regulatory domain-containing protein [Salibacteraceae bacterium]